MFQTRAKKHLTVIYVLFIEKVKLKIHSEDKKRRKKSLWEREIR